MTKNITYYAHWIANTYTIEYDGNAQGRDLQGSMANVTHTYDVDETLSELTYSITGWTFKEWNTEADGSGTSYANEAEVKNLHTEQGAKVILYAIWEDITAPVVRTVSSTSKEITFSATDGYNVSEYATQNILDDTKSSFS